MGGREEFTTERTEVGRGHGEERPKRTGKSACATLADLKFGHYTTQEKS